MFNRGSRSPGTFSPHASRQPSPKGSAELGNTRLHTTVSIQAENVMSFLKGRTLSSHKDPFRNPFLPVPTARAPDFGCFALFLNSSVRLRSRLVRLQWIYNRYRPLAASLQSEVEGTVRCHLAKAFLNFSEKSDPPAPPLEGGNHLLAWSELSHHFFPFYFRTVDSSGSIWWTPLEGLGSLVANPIG